ncbi:MAG: DUF456 domain-containing protein [Weeksellaceae bacterium]|nr:DUF456 domain-containing protein [Weeksellaceae bacterium]
MTDEILAILSVIMMIIAVFGSFLPVLPGPLLSWLGLLVFSFTSFADYGWGLLIAALIGVGLVSAADYILPAWGSKRFGGSRYGVYGTTIGLIVGIFFAPLGLWSIFVMPFLGAFIGEFIFKKRNRKDALRAATGSFIGFMMSSGLSLLLCIVFLAIVMWQLSSNAHIDWI